MHVFSQSVTTNINSSQPLAYFGPTHKPQNLYINPLKQSSKIKLLLIILAKFPKLIQLILFFDYVLWLLLIFLYEQFS